MWYTWQPACCEALHRVGLLLACQGCCHRCRRSKQEAAPGCCRRAAVLLCVAAVAAGLCRTRRAASLCMVPAGRGLGAALHRGAGPAAAAKGRWCVQRWHGMCGAKVRLRGPHGRQHRRNSADLRAGNTDHVNHHQAWCQPDMSACSLIQR